MFGFRKFILLFSCFVFCISVFVSCDHPEKDSGNKIDVNIHKGTGKFDRDTLYIGALNVDSYANDSLVKHDTLNIGVKAIDNIVLNPYFAESKYDFYIVDSMWEPLMKKGHDGQFYPNILKQLPAVSEDKTTYLFSLREDLFWEDGTKITSRDIEFTYKFLMDKFYKGNFDRELLNIKNWSDYRDGISDSLEGFEIVDDYNFRIVVETPGIYTLDLLNVYPLAFSYYGQFYYQGGADRLQSNDIKPFGNGVFKLLGYEQDKYLIFESNPFYFKGKSSINVLNFKVVDTNNFISDLSSGNVDMIRDLFWSKGNISEMSKVKFLSGYSFPSYEYFSIGINHSNSILKDLNVRKAIDLCINKSQIIKEVSGNDLSIIDAPIDRDFYNLSYSIHDINDNFNRNSSIKLLEDSGWKKTFSGVREKDGQKLEFKFLVEENNPVISKIFSFVKKDLESVGISLVVENTNSKILKDIIVKDKNSYDLFLVNSDFNFKTSWFKRFLTGGIENYYFYSNPYLDGILHNIFVEFDVEKIKSLYSDAYEIIKDDIPVISLFQNNQFDVYNGRILGINSANVFKTFYYDEIILKK